MDNIARNDIIGILEHNNDLTLATVRSDGYPQASIVSYVNDGLQIYFGTSSLSQKAKNIEACNKVSAALNAPYSSWDQIRGLSLAATAERVTNADELVHVGKLMVRKFPETLDYVQPQAADLVVYRISPSVISLLDYTKGFGHTQLVTV